MKRLTILISLFLVQTLSGCAVLTGASLTSQITTGKSLSEHAVSTATSSDCSLWLLVSDRNHTYYCEQRDIATTYNRNAY